LIFSLEMSAAQVAIRLYCARSRVSLRLLRTGMLGKNSMESMNLITAVDEISKAPLWIDDSSKLTIGEIQSRARTIAAKVGLGLIIVDYLQLISSEDRKMPREQQVAEASRGMKAMAKELDVPVIVLSQLNRASEKEKRLPRLSDLSSSGAIEQDADVVLMMTRPPDSDERYQTAGEAVDVIVAKQRNGPVGELRLTFLKDVTRFENYAQ
jgi:replicative DNA helicase